MDVPLGNNTALRNEMYHGWMSGPNTRSTTDILWTCIATVILCVYTAVHLNIPEPKERKRWQALRRAKWVVIAIFAPEVVLQAAWKQYCDARGLRDQLRERLRNHRTGYTDPDGYLLRSKQKTITTEVAIESLPKEDDITMVYCFYAIMGGFRLKASDGAEVGRTFTLTPSAIDEFAALGFFWDIETSAIEDKSKQDTLAKLLTVVQVAWMLIQCSARKISSLPLTLIEIHTFIHAVCAAIMFVLWFKKPLDVRDATVKASTPAVHELMYRLLDQEEVGGPKSRLIRRRVNYGRDRLGKISVWRRFDTMSAVDYGLDPTFDDHDNSISMWTFFGVFIIQAVYGCLHMTAWNSHFPSTLEKWSWRGSCIAIACSMVFPTIYVVIINEFMDWAEAKLDKYDKTRWWRICDPRYICYRIMVDVAPSSWVLMGVILILTSLVARGFIVTESLISLRSVPIGVYASVEWATYIPHL